MTIKINDITEAPAHVLEAMKTLHPESENLHFETVEEGDVEHQFVDVQYKGQDLDILIRAGTDEMSEEDRRTAGRRAAQIMISNAMHLIDHDIEIVEPA